MSPNLRLSCLCLVALAACNQPPEPPTISLTPDVPSTSDDLVVALGDLVDPNRGDVVGVSYRWSVQEAGEAGFVEREDLTGDRVPSALTRRGQVWKVGVTLTDGKEIVEVEETAPVTIANSKPVITFVKQTPDVVDTFATLVATAGAEDADGDPVTVSLAWYVNGQNLEIQGNTLTGEHFDKGDEVWVEAVAMDPVEPGDPMISGKVRVSNTPPRMAGATISPERVFEGSEVSCSPVGWYDADDDPAGADVKWYVNGDEVATTPTLNGASFNRGDLIRCMARPNDGEATGDWTVSPVVMVENTAPRVGGASIDDKAPKATGEVTYSLIGAVDDDGDPIQSAATWYVDDEEVASGAALAAGSFVRGQKIRALVVATDGDLPADPVETDTVTAANSAPSVSKLALVPTKLYTNDDAFPSVEAVDPDGDRISYDVTWRVNGSAVSEKSSVLRGADWFKKGDTVQVEITPTDGIDKGTTSFSDVLTVANKPPSVPEIAIDPAKPKSDEDLWCEVLVPSTDDDGDTLTTAVTWTRNGSPFFGADTLEYDGDYISADDTSDKDVWDCTVTVSDGTETVTATSSVKVEDWAGPRNWTPCGATGRLGPSQSQCNSAYSATNLSGLVTVTGSGIQEWVVPQDGTFRIEAWGAQGGKGLYGSYSGSKGARMRGDFALKKGDVLQILVGQMGTDGTYTAGGGGGTYVVRKGVGPLLVAGGGGATGYNYVLPSGCDGQTTTSARYLTSYTSSSCTTSPATAGYGGSYLYRFVSGTFAYYYYYGGGGAGYYGDGSAYYSSGNGRSFTNGGAGGDGSYSDGGFGGGGTGDSYYYYIYSGYLYGVYYTSFGSGGGGGWTGGGGSYYVAGGGGSYNIGSNPSNTAAVQTGAGKVTLDLAP